MKNMKKFNFSRKGTMLLNQAKRNIKDDLLSRFSSTSYQKH